MLYFKFFTHQNKIQLFFLPTMNKLNWVFYSVHDMHCFFVAAVSGIERYTSSFILLMYIIILHSLNSYCRKLEVGGTLMSPHTADCNTLGSSWYAFCALQIWNTVTKVSVSLNYCQSLLPLSKYRQWFLLQQFYYVLQHFQSAYLKFLNLSLNN